MFAGKGIVYSEGPTAELLQKGGTQELLQLWVNVPKSHKWDEPSYQAAARDVQPRVLEQQGVELRLASGSLDGKTGPLKSFTPVISAVGSIQKGRQVQINATPGYWILLYVAKGCVNVNQEAVKQHNLVVFEKENDEIIPTAEGYCNFYFFQRSRLTSPLRPKIIL